MLEGRLRVLVWAAYPALRAGLSELVREGGLEVAGELSTIAAVEAVDIAADVLVADIEHDSAAEEAARLAELLSLPAVVMVAGTDLPRAAARDLDVPRGWVSRATTALELATAIRAVAAGLLVLDPAFLPGLVEEPRSARLDPVAAPMQLTARELDVLRLLALGLPNKAIAIELGISEHTVKFHVGSVLSKLDARSRTEAVTTAVRLGLLTL